ncbi:MAG: hypothetical protein ACLGIK_08690 [Gemmatimonadota bacterium]
MPPERPTATAPLGAAATEGHPSDRYWRVLLGVAPRLLSLLDREQRSPTRGSFDRVNWGWKFRDFPLTMWQASMMPLATLYRTAHPANPYAGNGVLGDWLRAAMCQTMDRQHRNGAFDSFTPFSQDHGVTLAMVLTLCTTAELLDDALPTPILERVRESVSRACRFAASSDEDYAFINNHQAAFALAYVRASRLLGDERVLGRADEVLARIKARQSPDGWYEEYGGPDPGYETFGLTYLALVDDEHPGAGLAGSIAHSVAFLSHCVHPDGSIGGHYGSRNTGQYAPGGLELLAPRLPVAAAIAEFLGGRLESGNVVTPARCDDDNLPLLSYSYAVAATRAAPRPSSRPPLPCERDDVLTRFDDSRVAVASTPRYFAVTNLSKGGCIRVFDRRTGTLAYEDAGYFLSSPSGDWSTQLLGESSPTGGDAGVSMGVTARFAAVKRELLTPLKFLVLRILNLTVFRSVRLGAAVRRMIIARLITGRERGEWRLRRTITLEPHRVVLRDEVVPDGEVRVTFASLERSLLPVHMGSAKYFHANELAPIALPALTGWAEALSAGRAGALSQVIAFGDGAATHTHEVGIAPPTAPKERSTE